MGPTKFVQMMIQRWTLTFITSRSNLLPNYHKVPYDCDYQNKPINRSRERSDSVVECLTQAMGVQALPASLAVCVVSLSKTHLSLLSTGSTQEDPSQHN